MNALATWPWEELAGWCFAALAIVGFTVAVAHDTPRRTDDAYETTDPFNERET